MFEFIADWLIGKPEMPPRAGSGDIESGVAAVAEAVAAEKAREEAERIRARKAAEVQAAYFRCRTESAASKVDYGDMRFKSDPDYVAYSVDEYVRKPRRKRPNLYAAVLSFPARLLMYVRERCGGSGRIAYVRSGVSKQIYSRVTSWDDENADKKTVMKFCIGLQLGRSEADLLMKSAGYAFSDTIPIDKAFVYAIEHEMWNIHDVEALLVRNGLPDLGLDS